MGAVYAAFWVHYGSDYCPPDDFVCGQTCEEQARAKALADEFSKYQRSECEPDATPIAEDPDCYKFGWEDGMPQVTLEAALRWACEQLKKVSDRRCGSGVLHIPDGAEWAFDPCNGPLVLCTGEEDVLPGGTPGVGGNISKALPSGVSIDPSAWISPKRDF